MQLKDYLARPAVSATQVAREIGTSTAFLYQMSTGRRKVSVRLVKKIKDVTHGEVTERDLRPSDWHLIWPELAEAA